MNGTDVIVGIDGSTASRTALDWAAQEAARTGARLRVLLAYHWRWPGPVVATERLEQFAREQAEVVVDDAVADTRAGHPGLEVTGSAVLGTAADVLISAARTASLVVVGSRGHHGFTGALLGSVSSQVATHAPGSVAVVRGRADADTGPVVVGVDGSALAHEVLGTAFEHAARRDCELVAIRVYSTPLPPWTIGVPPLNYNPVQVRSALHDELAEDVARWQEKYPTVAARVRTPGGEAARALVEASDTAQLLVVGSRGHGGFTGLLLGSVSQHLLHHANCPVLIARDFPHR